MTDKRINEADIRRAWRHHAGVAAAASDGLDEALQGLEDGASAAQRERAAARLAEDARASDLGRALLALNADARELETGFLALRRPQRRFALPRIGLAMAAAAALAAVIVVPQWRGQPSPAPMAADEDALIVSSSFEGGTGSFERDDPDLLFRGDFDS